ncbi:MAG TPA: acyl carrier protein [Polyangiaceae bacterium]|nr:acyl carrier protein [Polyangiaceae bacterium]
MNETKEKLKNVLVKALRLDRTPESLPETNLTSELGIDSLKSLEFLVWVENTFGIQIDDADLSASLVDSLDTLAAYIETRTGAAAVGASA